MSVSQITNGAQGAGATDAIAGNGNSAAELKNEFLTLMVAQIQNQDPLNPMDGAEYVSQLAQFSTVEGVENMARMQQQGNIQLDTLQVLQSTQLVGKQVSVPASQIHLDETDSIRGSVQLGSSVSEMKVWAIGADGKVAGEVDLGAQAAGEVAFNLPPLAAGSYTLQAVYGRGGEVSTATPHIERTVEKVSVASDSGDVRLQLNGLGSISLFSVSDFLGASS